MIDKKYINKETDKKVIVTEVADGKVRVRYLVSGARYWYHKTDFERIFTPLDK